MLDFLMTCLGYLLASLPWLVVLVPAGIWLWREELETRRVLRGDDDPE